MFLLRYQILESIGSGQFGQVYRGRCLQTQEIVAIKELSLKTVSTLKFIRELRALSHSRHPNLVNLSGVEYSPDGRYLILEYCDRGTLRDVITQDDTIDWHDIPKLQLKLQLIQDILRGLSHLHDHGICHCDLKPENILLIQADTGLQAKVADLGSAIRREILINEQELGIDANPGSPAYMAPERFYGDFSPQTDLYSVGIMLYELLLQERPFSGQVQELTQGHLSKSLATPDSIPFFLKSILEKALQKLPHARFQSAAEMLERLDLALLMLQSNGNPADSLTSEPVIDFQKSFAY